MGSIGRRQFLALAGLTAFAARAEQPDWAAQAKQGGIMRFKLPQPAVASASAPALFPERRGPAILLFTDYNCPSCRAQHPRFMEAARQQPDVRVLAVITPIIAPSSPEVAAVALAAARQKPFGVLHEALFNAKGLHDAKSALALAGTLGYNVERLRKDANDPSVKLALDANIAQHKALQLHGVPVLAVGAEQFHFGLKAGSDYGPVFEAARRLA
ncbi:MAG: DsbA family protein [Telluria sp.]